MPNVRTEVDSNSRNTAPDRHVVRAATLSDEDGAGDGWLRWPITVVRDKRWVMDEAVLEQLRAGYGRLAARHPDSFAEVLNPDVHWHGVVSGVFSKRHAY